MMDLQDDDKICIYIGSGSSSSNGSGSSGRNGSSATTALILIQLNNIKTFKCESMVDDDQVVPEWTQTEVC